MRDEGRLRLGLRRLQEAAEGCAHLPVECLQPNVSLAGKWMGTEGVEKDGYRNKTERDG